MVSMVTMMDTQPKKAELHRPALEKIIKRSNILNGYIIFGIIILGGGGAIYRLCLTSSYPTVG